jgi:hypothetical protein
VRKVGTGRLNGAHNRLKLTLVILSLTVGGQIYGAPQTPRWQSPDGVRYPSDAGIVNVKTQYGAVGDGETDDTAAITRAIGENRGVFQRILYFPSGTYLISKTLTGKAENGIWRARLTLQGEDERTTIIRLKDHLQDFQDPSAPNPVIQTGSIQPYSQLAGAGNNGFRNYIFNLTVDTGRGNPGAIGIDYLGNNICGLEDVSIRSGDPTGMGVAGLSMRRTYVGPCLYKRIEIAGFDYGISCAFTEYSHTFEHLRLTGQRTAGISNSGNVLSIHDLESRNIVPAIMNTDSKGSVTLIDSTLQSSKTASPAIVNRGALLLRNISVSGYSITVDEQDLSPVMGDIVEYSSNVTTPGGSPPRTSRQSSLGNLTLNLPVKDAPKLGSYDLSKWVNVESKGAVPDGKTDSTRAIQASLDSDAEVVYLPAGNYIVKNTLHARRNTQKILGLGAVIVPDGPKFTDGQSPTPLLQFESMTSDVAVEGIQFGWWNRTNYPGTVWIKDSSPRRLLLEHVDFEGIASAVYEGDTSFNGALFIDDVAGFPWQFDGPQHIWARQFDVEGNVHGQNLVVNKGAYLWILGMKTEGPRTVIDTESGGFTELLGALLYPVRAVSPEIPAFIVNNSSAFMSYAVSAYRPETNYQIQVQLVREATSVNIKTPDVTKRGNGSLATFPNISVRNK